MHPTEGEWQAWFDGELDARSALQLEGHLTACPTCQALVADLRARLAETKIQLDQLSGPPVVDQARILTDIVRRSRRTRWRQSLLVAATVLVTVMGSAAAIARTPSIKNALGRWFGRPTNQPVAPGVPVPVATSNSVAIDPTHSVEIRFQVRQPLGDITVQLTDTGRVRITATDSVGYLFQPGGIVVLNDSAKASYVVTLPATLTQAVIRVGQTAVFTKRDARVEALGLIDRFHRYVIPFAALRGLPSRN